MNLAAHGLKISPQRRESTESGYRSPISGTASVFTFPPNQPISPAAPPGTLLDLCAIIRLRAAPRPPEIDDHGASGRRNQGVECRASGTSTASAGGTTASFCRRAPHGRAKRPIAQLVGFFRTRSTVPQHAVRIRFLPCCHRIRRPMTQGTCLPTGRSRFRVLGSLLRVQFSCSSRELQYAIVLIRDFLRRLRQTRRSAQRGFEPEFSNRGPSAGFAALSPGAPPPGGRGLAADSARKLLLVSPSHAGLPAPRQLSVRRTAPSGQVTCSSPSPTWTRSCSATRPSITNAAPQHHNRLHRRADLPMLAGAPLSTDLTSLNDDEDRNAVVIRICPSTTMARRSVGMCTCACGVRNSIPIQISSDLLPSVWRVARRQRQHRPPAQGSRRVPVPSTPNLLHHIRPAQALKKRRPNRSGASLLTHDRNHGPRSSRIDNAALRDLPRLSGAARRSDRRPDDRVQRLSWRASCPEAWFLAIGPAGRVPVPACAKNGPAPQNRQSGCGARRPAARRIPRWPVFAPRRVLLCAPPRG